MHLPLLHVCFQSYVNPFVSLNSSTEKKGRPRKTKRGGGAGGGARREARLSPLHESAVAGGQRTVGGGIQPITRGRSASEDIPRSKGKDHLPKIPAMNVKSSDEVRSLSLSGKGASATTPTTPPPASKGKDHLPEILAMNVKSSDEVRSSSLSGKGASATTPTTPPPASVPTAIATEQQSE